MKPKPAATRPDIHAMLRGLAAADVRYVLTGSVAAMAYGIRLEPGDFDIAPALDAENLRRLADLLRDWNAKPTPIDDPSWPDMAPEERERWTPEPPTAEQLDHLLTTRLGQFDVVPARSGTYEELVKRALALDYDGDRVLVAHPDDLVATLRLHKPKHERRLPHLEDVRRRLRGGEAVTPRLPSTAS